MARVIARGESLAEPIKANELLATEAPAAPKSAHEPATGQVTKQLVGPRSARELRLHAVLEGAIVLPMLVILDRSMPSVAVCVVEVTA